jgi:membrane-associated phospholipid phosphatase
MKVSTSVALLAVLFGALCAAPARAADSPDKPLTWSPEYSRVSGWEYAGTALLGAATLSLQFFATPPRRSRFSGGLLFDDAVRSGLRAGTPGGRARARSISDATWYGGMALPFVLDVPVALVRGDGVGGQMLAMDLEAFAVSGMINRLFELELGRARPGRDHCLGAEAGEYSCGTDQANVSMPSGHTLLVATAAGLTCVHHRYLPIWGNPAADVAACGLMVAATAATGVTRVIGDRHYATDVLAGSLIGFGVGYGLPWLLHYRRGVRAEAAGPIILPLASSDGFGVMGMAAF